MRLLFGFVGGHGHFEPLLPIARAAAQAGHEVAFTGRPGMVPAILAAGFVGFPTGQAGGDGDSRRPLLEFNAEREDQVLREGFARHHAAERAAALITLCADWQPDVIVCDEVDFGSMIAAEKLGLPYASVLVIASGAFVRPEVVAEPLNHVRVAYGLAPDPDLKMLSRYLILSPFPPRYRDLAFPLPRTAHSLRPMILEAPPAASLPVWVAALPDQPTLYFTLGTVFNRESGDLFTRVINGIRDLPINLIVTIGSQIDPAEFGPQPDNVHIERYIPQTLLFPHCDLVISHGGSGSVIGSLAHGLPSILLPMGADQGLNAACCERLGVGQVVDAVTCTSETIRQVVIQVLETPSYRHAAERMRDEIQALPGVDHALRLIEQLGNDKRPITSI